MCSTRTHQVCQRDIKDACMLSLQGSNHQQCVVLSPDMFCACWTGFSVLCSACWQESCFAHQMLFGKSTAVH